MNRKTAATTAASFVALTVFFLALLLDATRGSAATRSISTHTHRQCSVEPSAEAYSVVDWTITNHRDVSFTVTHATSNDSNARYYHVATNYELLDSQGAPGGATQGTMDYKIRSRTAHLHLTLRWDDGVHRSYSLSTKTKRGC